MVHTLSSSLGKQRQAGLHSEFVAAEVPGLHRETRLETQKSKTSLGGGSDRDAVGKHFPNGDKQWPRFSPPETHSHKATKAVCSMQISQTSAQVSPAKGWHGPRDLHFGQSVQMQGTQSVPGPDSS